MKKRIVYLTDYELIAYQAARKNDVLQEIGRFQQSDVDIKAFGEYLQQHAEVPIFILVDSVHEEYKHLNLPHVIGKDRYDLLSHRKKRFFEHTPYSHAVVQGREQQGRGDDKVLFTAITNPDLIEVWLDVINKSKVPLAGIFSMPLLSEFLLNYFAMQPYTLLVSNTPQINAHSVQGLRQNFYVNHKLKLSRLIAISDADMQNYAEALIKQMLTTQRYLGSIRLLPPSVELNVIILLPDEYVTLLNAYLTQNPVREAKINIISCSNFMQNLPNTGKNSCLHYLTAYYVLQNTPLNHYAKSTDIRYFVYHKLRLTMYILSIIIFLGSGTYTSLNAIDAWQLRQEVLALESQIKLQQQRIETLRANEPNLPTDVEIIRNVVNYGRILSQHRLPPHIALSNLSIVLNQHPSIELIQLDWAIADAEHELWSQNGLDPAKANYFNQGIRLQASIQAQAGDYRQALDNYRRFVQDLRNSANFNHITEVQPPFDPSALSSAIDVSERKVTFILDIFIQHNYVN